MDYRLKRQNDFNEVFQKGKRVYSNSVTLLYLKKNKLKIGISVSKKHGNAVKRNRIKRLIRAVYVPLLKNFKNCYVVFMPKTGIEFSFEDFSRDIQYLLKRENLVYEDNSLKTS